LIEALLKGTEVEVRVEGPTIKRALRAFLALVRLLRAYSANANADVEELGLRFRSEQILNRLDLLCTEVPSEDLVRGLERLKADAIVLVVFSTDDVVTREPDAGRLVRHT
jgi:hypothetical protein